jgi:hypothetical protein
MKRITLLIILFLSLMGSYAVAQTIVNSNPITLPQAPATEHIVPAGKISVITSATSITLKPGTHFQPGSDVTVKISDVFPENRLLIVSAAPAVFVNQNYTPWLNDDFMDLVQADGSDANNQYIDVRLSFEGKAELLRVALFDGQGTIAHPVTVYAVNGNEKTLIGTFDGTSEWAFIDFSMYPALTADAIIIHKFGNDIPLKVWAFGRLLPGAAETAPLAISLVSKQDIQCQGSVDGQINVLANGGKVVYESVYNGESYVKGPAVYHYSIDGATYQKSGTFINLKAGIYTVYVRDAFNFQKQIAVQITEPSKLLVNESVTQINCAGGCTGGISLATSGGVAPYTYNWINQPSFGNKAAVSGLCVGNYQVYITDSKGCEVVKNIEIKSDEVLLTGIEDMVLCQNTKVVLSAGNPGATYSWTSNNGFASSLQNVEISQAGNYNLTVTNTGGCSKTQAFTVDVNAEVFKAEFLVSSVVNVGDSVYVIDISKPSPSGITWKLPSGMHEIYQNSSGSIKQIVFDAVGDYSISMTATSGQCSDIMTKNVRVLERTATGEVNTALGYKDELIKKATAFPNPSNGEFHVRIELSEIQDVKLRLIGVSNNQLIEMKQDTGKREYVIRFDHPELQSSLYFVVIEVGNAVRTLKVIKI